ncbi:MAG: AAA-like domain-containing protein [Bacteroidales bacterium]|nr:AAA-like domain-containing protein [Bacteroidales bacterium]
MAKRFNTSVTCDPKKHYMVDTTAKMKVFEHLIDNGNYFTITRARQFGKTSSLKWIYNNLNDKYLVISISFEDTEEDDWISAATFYKTFCGYMVTAFQSIKIQSNTAAKFWEDAKQIENADIKDLSSKITEFCQLESKKVVLLIDEVDKSLNNQLFLNFLSMLRKKYIDRDMTGDNSTFWSVVLAGVYDVKNLKLKIRPDEQHQFNSPWNVAADYDLDMTFNPQEISTMLADYENDYHFGFDIKEISEEIYKYTSGYPVLVSQVCKVIDEILGKVWTKDNVLKAVKYIADDDKFVLLDDISKNLQRHSDLHDLLYDITINGTQYMYSPVDPVMKLAIMFSYIKKSYNSGVDIHNLIFEDAIHTYFINEYRRNNSKERQQISYDYIQNGELNMEMVIGRFKEIMADRYKDRDQQFLEYHGRLLFLCFIKPIINGTGFCYFEPQTKNGGRVDLIVNYNQKEYIVELKIWRGSKYETDGKTQLANYLKQRNLSEGYLITFSFLKNKVVQEQPEWIEHDGKRIFEAVI